ncbi:MAG: ABC transporter ATP-binding protein [Candidatus Pacearchaeota archaeon]|nr:ABC transporter ATP-binding protein [Candidatus Pacearchaeota archaeon]
MKVKKEDYILHVENLTKIYDSNGIKVKAVDGITFSVPKNKVLAIMGPSGSGKSTLLHLIGCLDKPTSGKIYIDNIDTSKLNDDELAKLRNKKIGFGFQFFNLHPLLTAVENVELPEIIANKPEKERREKAMKLLKLVGLEERAHHFPSQLSGGEQQRVAIARALINDPMIIMADEPTGNLDTKSGHEIMKLLVKLKEKSTVIVITHDIDIAEHADHLVKMKDGKIEYVNGFSKKLL